MRPLQLSLALVAGLLFSGLAALAWTGPQNTPPNCVSGQAGCDAPINVGPTTQIKGGSLGILANLQLAGAGGSYLNFGATAGTSGYGIRDNGGTLEFKSSGGNWNNLTNTITNVLGIGAVTSLKFSDGTTQTTAAASGGATGDVQTFLSSGTWSAPASGTLVRIQCWGGGGGGAGGLNSSNPGAGGGGGGYNETTVLKSSLTSTVTVTIGAGGTAGAGGVGGLGGLGGISTFGSYLSAYGGGGGFSNATGGGGGGQTGAGGNGQVGAGAAGTPAIFNNGSASGQTAGIGAFWGGGGGGGGNGNIGGSSVFGGAGGGSAVGGGGTSAYGGAGGGRGVAGTQPGGGGGGGIGSGGNAGAAGKCIATTY